MLQYHYTTRDAGKAISSQEVWSFKAHQPPSGHPLGAYFTTLPVQTRNLAKRLRLPLRKTEHFFAFTDAGDLLRLPGGRGDFIFYSTSDYLVVADRQEASGLTVGVQENIQ